MSGIVDHLTDNGGSMAARSYPYPFINDWRKGCWVARPTGKADRDYVYSREFLRGSPDRGSGTLRYTLADLGGPGWVVAKDSRGRRALIEVGDLEWVDHGEVTPADVLRVVRAETWNGSKCSACSVGVLLADETTCGPCEIVKAEAEASKASLEALPDGEVF